MDQPRVDRAERESIIGGKGSFADQPFELGPAEVGIENQAGAGPDHVEVSIGGERIATIGGAAVLPDDGGAEWLARGAIPGDHGLALVGDADRGDVVDAHFGDDLRQGGRHRRSRSRSTSCSTQPGFGKC